MYYENLHHGRCGLSKRKGGFNVEGNKLMLCMCFHFQSPLPAVNSMRGVKTVN
jgi:hypothetical protein